MKTGFTRIHPMIRPDNLSLNVDTGQLGSLPLLMSLTRNAMDGIICVRKLRSWLDVRGLAKLLSQCTFYNDSNRYTPMMVRFSHGNSSLPR